MSVLDALALGSRVAIVTGSNRGLGEAFAHALAGAGAAVVIAARNPSRSAAAVEAIPADGGHLLLDPGQRDGPSLRRIPACDLLGWSSSTATTRCTDLRVAAASTRLGV